jgi:hypothetical protein
MLKDKYDFELGYQTISSLQETLTQSIHRQKDLKNLSNALVLLTLIPFVKRLERIVLNPKPPRKNQNVRKYKFSLKRAEAIAFHLAYMRGLIFNDHFAVADIFQTIDKTV